MKNIPPSFRICAQRLSGRGKRYRHVCFSRLAYIFMLIFLLVPLELAVSMPQVSYAEQKVAQEYELKAVYLYNFLQFIQWPESQRMLSKDGAMVIGIVGQSPFGSAFDELEATLRKTGRKPVKVIYYGPYREGLNMRNCHILFVSASERKNFSKIIADLSGLPVLTVADTEGFFSAGGMIELVKERGKIRWEINRAKADEAGLRFSSQLLTLAVRVVGG